MGNCSSGSGGRNQIEAPPTSSRFASQISLSSFVGNLSGRSFLTVASNRSGDSSTRPWSRVSRRRWNNATLTNHLAASKTAWPVPHVESLFLPEFKISSDISDKKFIVLDTISKGAFGKVYKVKKKDSNELFALKVLSKGQVICESAIRQVKDEAHIQEVCGHNPFIVASILKWQSRKRLYIVTEYVPGGELLALLEKYRILPEALVQIYIAEIALVLDFLHNAGIIYRDLKPENLLLNAFGHIQLIDFGLSKWLKYGSRTTTLCGTLQYMAPEVLNQEPYGHAADWWSLGVIAYRMLTDRYPGAGEPEPPGAAGRLVSRLLDPSPERRLRSLRALRETPFFKSFDFSEARSTSLRPNAVLKSHFPDGPAPSHPNEAKADGRFSEFDEPT